MLRMIDCRTGGELDVGLADLVQGGVFYDEGGVYVRAQILNRYPRIVTEMGLICSFGGLSARLRRMGASRSWCVIRECGAMLAFDPRSGEVRDFGLCQGDVFEAVGGGVSCDVPGR